MAFIKIGATLMGCENRMWYEMCHVQWMNMLQGIFGGMQYALQDELQYISAKESWKMGREIEQMQLRASFIIYKGRSDCVRLQQTQK